MSEINTTSKQIRTMKCGCDECRFKSLQVKVCPKESSPDAKWLWASNPNYIPPKTTRVTAEEMMEELEAAAAETDSSVHELEGTEGTFETLKELGLDAVFDDEDGRLVSLDEADKQIQNEYNPDLN